jgi:hypothetical protein
MRAHKPHIIKDSDLYIYIYIHKKIIIITKSLRGQNKSRPEYVSLTKKKEKKVGTLQLNITKKPHIYTDTFKNNMTSGSLY